MRQLLMAAPVTDAVDTGTAFSWTVTASESGVLVLSDSILAAHMDTPTNVFTNFDLSSALELTGLAVNGSTLLIRGRSTPSAPNPFQAKRKGNLVNFPAIRVKAADTIQLRGTYTYTTGAGQGYFGIPFSPDRFRNAQQPTMGLNETWVGSPTTAVADDTAVAVTATLNDDGIIDLSRLCVAWNVDATATVGQDAIDGAWNGGITSINIAGRYDAIVGQNTPEAPMGFFNAQRERNLVDLGRHRVSSGETIVVTVKAKTGADGDATIGFPLYSGDLGSFGGTNLCK